MVDYVSVIDVAQQEYEKEQCRLAGLLQDAVNTGVNNVENGTTSLDVQVCFPAGFEIDLADGTVKKIEEFKGGEEVWARPHDDPSGPLRKCRVVRVFKNAPEETIKILFDNNLEIHATVEHPFFVPEKGWVACGNLETDDVCVNRHGELVRVVSKELVTEKVPVYNIEVEGAHTYYIGKNGKSLLVHNYCLYKPGDYCMHPRCCAYYFPSPYLPAGRLFDPFWDIPTVYSNARTAGHGRIMSAYVAGGTGIGTAIGVTGVTTFYDPTDPVTGDRLSRPEQIEQTAMGGISLVGTAFGVKAGGGRLSKIVTKYDGSPGGTPVAPTPRTWTAKDPYVPETANAIEKAFPGKVLDVNACVKNKNGIGHAGEFDILLDDAVIQVKGGSAKKLVKQMEGTTIDALDAAGMDNHRIFGYAPDRSDSYIQTQQFQGRSITNNIDELLNWIGGK